MKRIILTAVLFLFAAACHGADEIAAGLQQAQTARTNALKKASQDLLDEFDKAIKTVAATGDLEATKKIVNEKAEFLQGTEPHTAALVTAADAYRMERKIADLSLMRAFDSAIESYTKQVKITEATAIQTEREKLVASENKYLIAAKGKEESQTSQFEVSLAFDQDEGKIRLTTGDIPKEATLQLEITSPVGKITETAASIRTNRKLALCTSPQVEVTFEVRKSAAGHAILKITPWFGNKTSGIPCNLDRMQRLLADLPGKIQSAQNGIASTAETIKSQEHDLEAYSNGGWLKNGQHYSPPSKAPGVSPGALVAQQTTIQTMKSHLSMLRGKQTTLARAADRYAAQLNELPGDIEVVTKLVGTKVRYRIYYVADGKEITVPVTKD